MWVWKGAWKEKWKFMVVQGLHIKGCLNCAKYICNCQWGSHSLPTANIWSYQSNSLCDDTAWQLALYIWLHKYPNPKAWNKNWEMPMWSQKQSATFLFK